LLLRKKKKEKRTRELESGLEGGVVAVEEE
jgi:hypothetical protein